MSDPPSIWDGIKDPEPVVADPISPLAQEYLARGNKDPGPFKFVLVMLDKDHKPVSFEVMSSMEEVRVKYLDVNAYTFLVHGDFQPKYRHAY